MKKRFVSILTAALCICLMLSLAPAAFAQQADYEIDWWSYGMDSRALEQRGSDGSRIVYHYDRDGFVVRKELYENNQLVKEIEYVFDGGYLVKAVEHIADTQTDVYHYFDCNGTEIGRDDSGGMGDTIRESFNSRGRIESVTVTRSYGSRETGEYRYNSDGCITYFYYGNSDFRTEEQYTYNSDGSWTRDRRDVSGSGTDDMHILEMYNEYSLPVYRTETFYGSSVLYCYEYTEYYCLDNVACISDDAEIPMTVTSYRYDDYGNLTEIWEDGELTYSCSYEFDQGWNLVRRTERCGSRTVVYSYTRENYW